MLDTKLVLDRRALITGGASCVVSQTAFIGQQPDVLLALAVEWQQCFARFLQPTETQYRDGVEEQRLYALTDRLLNRLTSSVAGIIIKLDLLCELSRIECGDAEAFPFPQLKLVRRDLSALNEGR